MKKNSNNEIELAKLDLIRHLRKVVKNYNNNLTELKELEEKEEMFGLSREETTVNRWWYRSESSVYDSAA